MRFLGSVLLGLVIGLGGSPRAAGNCPGGSNGQIQYNQSNGCAGHAALTFDASAGPTTFLTTPTSTNSAWDVSPLAALFVRAPVVASSRNFISGIWVETNGAAQDKGRGIAVHNLGHSDAFYAQLEGDGACGYCGHVNSAGFGTAIGLANPLAVGTYVKESPGGGGANLQTFEANESGASEMLRFNSTQSGKAGMVFRMSGTGNQAMVVDTPTGQPFKVRADTGSVEASSYAVAGQLGVTVSGVSCTITAITGGIVTGAVCQ